ncbi:MAG: WD40 repeat domain-containing protein [Planctomycetes bacterium]|nr:WD40 repeat domain-containing protein [Planctomycetota bacterium]
MWIQEVADGSVNAVTYSPDGSILYTQDSGRWFTAWDLATHEGRRLFQYPEKCSDHFPRMFTSPDGRYLVANTSPATVWDLVNEELHTEVPSKHAFAGISMGVGRVRVECVSDDWLGIRTWDFVRQSAGDELREWDVPGTIKTHHFSPDGSRVALLNWSDVVTIADVPTRTMLHRIDFPKRSLQHCRFAPDGKTLVMYSSDGISIWDMQSESFRVDKVECDRPYWMLAFHPSSQFVGVRRKDGVLCLVSLQTGEEIRSLDFDLGKQATCLAFSPDGLTCAVGGTEKRFAVFDLDV